jgi:chromosomal replication initiator protein
MTHTDLWKTAKENLKNTHPQHAFSTWFEPITSIGLNNNNLILEVPNQFFFEWIQSHYKNQFKNKRKKRLATRLILNIRSLQKTTNQKKRKTKAEEKRIRIHQNKSKKTLTGITPSRLLLRALTTNLQKLRR